MYMYIFSLFSIPPPPWPSPATPAIYLLSSSSCRRPPAHANGAQMVFRGNPSAVNASPQPSAAEDFVEIFYVPRSFVSPLPAGAAGGAPRVARFFTLFYGGGAYASYNKKNSEKRIKKKKNTFYFVRGFFFYIRAVKTGWFFLFFFYFKSYFYYFPKLLRAAGIPTRT